jgi:hypothetical protein
MTTATPATAARTILALDFVKCKSVACACDPATAQARFDTQTHLPRRNRKLFARHSPTIAVIAFSREQVHGIVRRANGSGP